MKPVVLAAAALAQTPLAYDENLANVRGALDDARALGATIVCLPELCLTGYGCEDAFLFPSTERRARELLLELAPSTRGLLVSVGLPFRHQGALFNVSAVLVDGEVVALVPKQSLAGDGIHYEPRWFKGWPRGVVARARLCDREVPIGDLVVDASGVRVGFEICEDAWVARRPGGDLAERAVDVVLNPSASHFALGKRAVRERLVLEGSRAFGVSYVYANLLGNEAGRALYDGHLLVASGGELVARSARLGFARRSVIAAQVDVELTRARRAALFAFRPAVQAQAHDVVTAFDPESHARPAAPVLPAWESVHTREEELVRAIALGLYGYGVKSKTRGFVVSLSGGADSAACAYLVRLMLDLACAELGVSHVAASFGHGGLGTVDELCRAVLTTVYQATANSGETTRRAAREVAAGLSATHHEVDVEGMVGAARAEVERALGRPLAWTTDDVALQNVQARVRAPVAWLFANVEAKLLLATSNRSEAAVGYATMDGDTAGGLSPIAGIDKPFLREVLSWLERVGPSGKGPMPALGAVNALAPTAELRPADRHQTDEDDLMPYPVLDLVEQNAVRDRRSPLEVFEAVADAVPDAAVRARWVAKFFRLFVKNQWKRERYAPSFHLDDESLDPKTWCRFPILSGGFADELAALDRIAEGAA